jgi:hypothetical protein
MVDDDDLIRAQRILALGEDIAQGRADPFD